MVDKAIPGGVVDFDFVGSLQLARQLWSLSTDLREQDRARGADAEVAAREWRGKPVTDFAGRREHERQSRATVTQALVNGANAWAQAWAQAMDQQNLNNRAAKIERDERQISDDRGRGQKFVDAFNGDDSWDKAVAQNPEPA